jgi:hypothetical protein
MLEPGNLRVPAGKVCLPAPGELLNSIRFHRRSDDPIYTVRSSPDNDGESRVLLILIRKCLRRRVVWFWWDPPALYGYLRLKSIHSAEAP